MRACKHLLIPLVCLLFSAPLAAEAVRILVQRSPLAGSQYYAASEVWETLRVGDVLQLVREPDNRHDKNAVRVEWQGRQLGYLPRAENRAVAAAMDDGERVVGRIERLTRHPDPWRRVQIEMYVDL